MSFVAHARVVESVVVNEPATPRYSETAQVEALPLNWNASRYPVKADPGVVAPSTTNTDSPPAGVPVVTSLKLTERSPEYVAAFQ